ncbi:hypothetical protein L7F22_063169 [Adiantum nelumboides]|nr:hypothetical protein [Adiantum nelumboides]
MALMAAASTTSCTALNRGVACRFSPLSASTSGRYSGTRRQLLQVSCDSANKDQPGGGKSSVPVANAPAPLADFSKTVRESVDSVTKQPLGPADIERHQTQTSSEKQSILGARPSSTTPWPRPELERRPETGDRSFVGLFAVDGAAPETINGRMAMLGFVWAFVAEKTTGLSVMEQLFHPSTFGLIWFTLVVQLFTLASVIPFVNGESTDARRWGPFTARAERWNGRLAMIGFATLIVDEMIRQGALFH